MKNAFNSLWIVMVALVAMQVAAQAADTKYATGTVSAAVTFGPSHGQRVVKSIYTSSDKTFGLLKFFVRGDAGKMIPTTDATNGAPIIFIANTALTNGDRVVYSHANGVLDYTTATNPTSSNITLVAAITVAGAAGDALYELTQAGQIMVGDLNSGATSNKPGNFDGPAIFVSPADSPVHIEVEGLTNIALQVTAD